MNNQQSGIEEESKGGSPGSRDEHSQVALMPPAESGDAFNAESSGSFLPPINQKRQNMSSPSQPRKGGRSNKKKSGSRVADLNIPTQQVNSPPNASS